MTLFRENALKAVQSPELTHSEMKVITPPAKLGMLAILLMLFAMTVWGWLYNIPMAVQGSGMVVLQRDWLQAVHENDFMQAMKREQLVRATALLEKKRALFLKQGLTETELVQAENEVMQAKNALANPSVVPSIGVGNPFTASVMPDEVEVALVLVSDDEAKQLSNGMKVRLYPKNQGSNENAAIVGEITEVTPYPVSKEMALAYMGNRAMIDALFAEGIPHLAVIKPAQSQPLGMLVAAKVITHTCHPIQLLSQADC